MRNNWHFWSIHLISINEVTEKSYIWVDKVKWLMKNHIWIVSKPSMERIVLKMSWVKMNSCELITSVTSYYSFEVIHSEIVRVIPWRSNKSNWKASVQHLVISLIHQWRSEERLITIWNFTDSWSRSWTKMTINSWSQSRSIDRASTTYDNILSNVEIMMELFNLLRSDRIDDIFVTSWRLSHVMILNESISTLKAV